MGANKRRVVEVGRYATFEDAGRAHRADSYQYIQHDGHAWILFQADGPETFRQIIGQPSA